MSKFKKALKQEKNIEARRHLDAFYQHNIRIGKIENYIMTEWAEDSPEAQILQFVGCDVAFKYGFGKYKFVDEKVCKNYNEMLYFEMGKANSSAHTGWAVSEYKKTDILVYYIEGVGLFVLPFKQLGEWLKANENSFERHYSSEDKGRTPNRNVRVHMEAIREQFPNSFIAVEELEIMSKT